MSATRTVMSNHQSNGNVRVQGEHGNGLAGHQPKSRAHLSPPPHKSKFPLDFFLTELRRTLRQPESGRISAILAANLCSIAVSSYWSSVTNSLSLSAFNGVTWFHVMSLLTCYLTVFVKTQNQRPIRNVAGLSQAAPVTIDAYSLGYARLEVLAVFSATVLSQLGAVFVVKESLERMLDPPEIHPGRLLPGALVCLCSHLLSLYFAPNAALGHVVEVSSSSWLQEHTTDLAHSVCSVFPPLSSLLLPRVHPMAMLSAVGFSLVFLMDIMIEINNVHFSDCVVSLLLAMFVVVTMYPMSVYTGRILLQTTPTHILPQLERYLSEALAVDGVIEFKNEHFWTISFGKLAGSLTVCVRKDADEQFILGHITDRLSNLVWPLTIQIRKDDAGMNRLSGTSRQMLAAGYSKRESPTVTAAIIPGLSPVNGHQIQQQQYLSPDLPTSNSGPSVTLAATSGSSSFFTSTPNTSFAHGANGLSPPTPAQLLLPPAQQGKRSDGKTK